MTDRLNSCQPRRNARLFTQKPKLIGALLLALTTTACTSLFFFPSTTLLRTPADLKLEYKDVYLETRDNITVHGWWIQPTDSSIDPQSGFLEPTPRGRVLFLHGNAENISTHIASVRWLLKNGFQVFALDYRGYGLSLGKPAIPEVFEDIRAASQWLSSQPAYGKSILFAQSLGASLAFGALWHYPEIGDLFDGIISEAAFSEYDLIAREVAGSHWLTAPFGFPASWLIQSTYDPVLLIDHIDIPKVFVHSVDDRIVGLHHAHRLYDAATGPKQLIVTNGAHITAVDNSDVVEKLLMFIHSKDPTHP